MVSNTRALRASACDIRPAVADQVTRTAFTCIRRSRGRLSRSTKPSNARVFDTIVRLPLMVGGPTRPAAAT